MEIDVIQRLNRLISQGQIIHNKIEILFKKVDPFDKEKWNRFREYPHVESLRLDYYSWNQQVLEFYEKYDPEMKESIENEFDSFETCRDIFFISQIIAGLTVMKDVLWLENKDRKQINSSQGGKNVFIVHGHSELLIAQTEAFLQKIGYEPIILRNKASRGQTIIEKLESNTDVAFAIVLYTSCDRGGINDVNSPLKPRARQNVVFEHGYLNAKLGRNKVCALVEDGVEYPGDLSGIVYIPIDKNGAWKLGVAKEMKAAGLIVDLNKM